MLFFDRKPASEKPWTEKLWIYDLRTNQHFTLKERTLKSSDLDEFVQCFHAENRHERIESDRFKGFAYDELLKRDKVNLDIFWLRDESLEDSAHLPDPDVLALEIAEEPCDCRPPMAERSPSGAIHDQIRANPPRHLPRAAWHERILSPIKRWTQNSH